MMILSLGTTNWGDPITDPHTATRRSCTKTFLTARRTQHSQEETSEADGLAGERDGAPSSQAKTKGQRRRQAKARATEATKATQAAAALTARAARLGCTESELEDDDGSLAWEARYGDESYGYDPPGYGDGQEADSDGPPENYDGYDVN